MKKMFVTGMNMNAPKAYIEPEMKVIEVDVECLQTVLSGEQTGENNTEDSEEEEEGVKLYKNYWF